MSTAPEQPGPKPLVWLHGEVKTPPFSREARLEAGSLLRLLQQGESLGMPRSRPMPGIGHRCHELRITDENRQWRIVYRVDDDAIVIAEVFPKTTRATPRAVIETCRGRFTRYDAATEASSRAKTGAKKRGGRGWMPGSGRRWRRPGSGSGTPRSSSA